MYRNIGWWDGRISLASYETMQVGVDDNRARNCWGFEVGEMAEEAWVSLSDCSPCILRVFGLRGSLTAVAGIKQGVAASGDPDIKPSRRRVELIKPNGMQ